VVDHGLSSGCPGLRILVKIPEGRNTRKTEDISSFEELDIPFGGLKASSAGSYLKVLHVKA
jgi:hypothetical protein